MKKHIYVKTQQNYYSEVHTSSKDYLDVISSF